MTIQLKNILHTCINAHNSWKLSLLKDWPTIVGNLSSKMSLLKIDNDNLIIGVYDSCWLQELYLLSPTILQLINQTLDQPRIKQLRFKLIGTSKKTTLSREYKKEFSPHATYTLSKKEQSSLQNIKDSELRNALKKFLIRCHREGGNEEKQTITTHDNSDKPTAASTKKP